MYINNAINTNDSQTAVLCSLMNQVLNGTFIAATAMSSKQHPLHVLTPIRKQHMLLPSRTYVYIQEGVCKA